MFGLSFLLITHFSKEYWESWKGQNKDKLLILKAIPTGRKYDDWEVIGARVSQISHKLFEVMFPLICQAFPYVRKSSGVLKALLIFLMICWGCLRLRLKRSFSAAWLVNFWYTELTFLSKIFAKHLSTLANVWVTVCRSLGQKSHVKRQTLDKLCHKQSCPGQWYCRIPRGLYEQSV